MRDIERYGLWAALVPLLLVIVIGVRDFGGIFFDQRKLANAAFEATKWAKAYGYDSRKAVEVAQSATTLGGVSVTALRPCGCIEGKVIRQAECDAACPGGGWSQPYIVIAAAMCYRPDFSWPGLSYCSSGNTQCIAAGCNARQLLLSAQSVVPQ